jgi:hypothetical protein
MEKKLLGGPAAVTGGGLDNYEQDQGWTVDHFRVIALLVFFVVELISEQRLGRFFSPGS